jgi:transposase InsO family protein
MRYQFIESHRKVYPVTLMCQVLEVSRAGFYDWRHRAPSERSKRHADLTAQVQVTFDVSRQTYGSPRITHELLDQGIKVCRNTVARIMRKSQLAARQRRRFVPRTTDSSHDQPIAPNHLDRRFEAGSKAPRAWVGDITYIPTEEGWLYLAAIMDLQTRKIVGWATADHLRVDLVLGALHMALANSKHPPEGLVHHSDRGVQYACRQYREALEARGIVCSMSRSGDCYDNAAMESLWATIKTEEVYRTIYATREQARQCLFEYIEAFYNRQRRHSALGYLSPEAFEARMN